LLLHYRGTRNIIQVSFVENVFFFFWISFPFLNDRLPSCTRLRTPKICKSWWTTSCHSTQGKSCCCLDFQWAGASLPSGVGIIRRSSPRPSLQPWHALLHSISITLPHGTTKVLARFAHQQNKKHQVQDIAGRQSLWEIILVGN
jgi:hypothetical protein